MQSGITHGDFYAMPSRMNTEMEAYMDREKMVHADAMGLSEEIVTAAHREAKEMERVEDHARIFTVISKGYSILWSPWSERTRSSVKKKTRSIDPFL